MKKPFKLNAYYLVNMGVVGQCNALDDLGLEYNGKAVIFMDASKYCIDVDRDIKVNGENSWLLTHNERKYCKRCDNAFVAGVTYIDSDEVEYLCKRDDHEFLILLDESDGETYSCDNYSPKDFTPKVGMIN